MIQIAFFMILICISMFMMALQWAMLINEELTVAVLCEIDTSFPGI